MFCETNLIQEITGFTLDILVFHYSQGAMQLAVVQEKKKRVDTGKHPRKFTILN